MSKLEGNTDKKERERRINFSICSYYHLSVQEMRKEVRKFRLKDMYSSLTDFLATFYFFLLGYEGKRKILRCGSLFFLLFPLVLLIEPCLPMPHILHSVL